MARRFKVRDIGSSVIGFNGSSNNDVAKASPNNLAFGASQDFSAAVWFKSKQMATGRTLLGQRAGILAANVGWTLHGPSTSGNSYFEISDGVNEINLAGTGGAFIADGKWHMIAVTCARLGLASVYVDGVLDKTVSIATVGGITNVSTLRLGRDGGGGNRFDGVAAAPRIWKRLLTAAEIADVYYDGLIPHREDLVLEWLFSQGSTGIITDTSGNSNDGTLSGTAPWLDGPIKPRVKIRQHAYSLDFDGASNVATLYHLPVTGSISVWVKPKSFFNFNSIWDSSGNSNQWESWIDAQGKVQGRTGSSSQVGNAIFPDLGWHHYVFTWASGGSAKIYIDGLLVGAAQNVTDADSGSSFYWGGGNAGNTPGILRLANGKVFKQELTSAEVQALYFNARDPYPPDLWHKMDEGSGSTVLDYSGNGRNGVITGATYSTDTPMRERTIVSTPGRLRVRDFGTSLSFDGVDDFVDVPHAANQLLTGGFTLSAWIKPYSFGEGSGGTGGGRIVDKSTGTLGQNGFSYFVESGRRMVAVVNGVSSVASASDSIPFSPPRWIHVLVTVDANGLVSHYVNGVLSGTPSSTSALSGITTTNAMRIGNRATATDRTFNGAIDAVRIFSKVLAAAEVLRLYTSGNFDRSSGLIGEYLFNEGSGSTAIDSSPSANNGTITGATYSTDVPLIERTKVT